MPDPSSFWDAVFDIRSADGRFSEEAYAFVMESLEYTIVRIGAPRHVSAAELLEGLCACAKERFGMLAWTVLERWGVASASDIGTIVFQLVDAGVLSRRDDDAKSDFDEGFDLRVALEDDYFGAGAPPEHGTTHG